MDDISIIQKLYSINPVESNTSSYVCPIPSELKEQKIEYPLPTNFLDEDLDEISDVTSTQWTYRTIDNSSTTHRGFDIPDDSFPDTLRDRIDSRRYRRDEFHQEILKPNDEIFRSWTYEYFYTNIIPILDYKSQDPILDTLKPVNLTEFIKLTYSSSIISEQNKIRDLINSRILSKHAFEIFKQSLRSKLEVSRLLSLVSEKHSICNCNKPDLYPIPDIEKMLFEDTQKYLSLLESGWMYAFQTLVVDKWSYIESKHRPAPSSLYDESKVLTKQIQNHFSHEYLDLRKQLQKSCVKKISNLYAHFKLNQPSSSSKPESVLSPITDIVKLVQNLSKLACTGKRIKITAYGYTDGLGDLEYNTHLSFRRAQWIANLLKNSNLPFIDVDFHGCGFHPDSSPGIENTEHRMVVLKIEN